MNEVQKLAKAQKDKVYGKAYRRQLRLDALNQYGNYCAHCRISVEEVLQIDHIENDGAVERRALGGQNYASWHFYKWLRDNGWPEGYQTLCANCNIIKYRATQ